MSKSTWYEDPDLTPARAGWHVGLWVAVVLVAVLVVSVVLWALGVFTSDIKGRGDQRKQINSANNRTFAQEMFEELYQDIQGYDAQVGTTAAQVAATTDPAERDRLNAVLLGLKNQCISTTRQYDAEARKVTRERFRAADLPDRIDTQDPAFDCQENAS